MTIHTEKAVYNITLREYKDNKGFLCPDMFDDLETLMGWKNWRDEDNNLCMDDKDVNTIIDWWEREVDFVNEEHMNGEILDALNDGIYLFVVDKKEFMYEYYQR